MTKFFYCMGIIFTALLVVVGFSIGAIHFYSQGLDNASKQVADNAVPKIAAKWDANVWYNFVDMSKAGVTDEQFAQFLTTVQTKLGDLKEYKGSQGSAKIGVQLDPRAITLSANYEALIECEHGPAKINLSLLKEDSGWKIIGFHVVSPVLNAASNPPPAK